MAECTGITSVDALDRLLAAHATGAAAHTPTLRVTLAAAHGRVLRQTVCAERPSPPFHRSAMDGIALALSAFANGQRAFPVGGCQRAGDPESFLPSSVGCVEIMTGAVLPVGADVVVRVEDVTFRDGVAHLPADYTVKAMQNVHAHGSDHPADTPLLQPGCLLRAPQIAILASCGVAFVEVAAWPRIAVIATGDELVPVEGPVAPHQIRMSNVHAIAAGLRQAGLDGVTTHHLPDDLESLRRDIGGLLETHDGLILSGGISVGKYDFIAQVLREHALMLHVTQVQQRPGKPFAFGTRAPDGRFAFALPGNPVSTLVCLRRYVLPTLFASAGLAAAEPPLRARLASAYRFKPALTLYLPVRLELTADGWLAHPGPTNGSGDWAALGTSDGFVQIPAENDETPAGTVLPLYLWSYPPPF